MLEQAQSVYVSTAHRYWNPDFSDARNRELYGPQASPEGVGNNLRLEAGIRQDSRAEFDFQPALLKLKAVCDHRCLFSEEEVFKRRPSTLENITLELGRRLFAEPGPWSHLTVAESAHLECTIRPQSGDVVELRVRVLNLEVVLKRVVDSSTGLAFSRREVWDAVRTVAPDFAEPAVDGDEAWLMRLFSALKIKVNGLIALAVDVGGQRILRVRSES